MEEWKKKRDSLLDPYDDQVMIASHRGKFSSSVMENTSLAFLAAVGQGADMVEMDLAMTSDGVLVGHHDDNMTGCFMTQIKSLIIHWKSSERNPCTIMWEKSARRRSKHLTRLQTH